MSITNREIELEALICEQQGMRADNSIACFNGKLQPYTDVDFRKLADKICTLKEPEYARGGVVMSPELEKKELTFAEVHNGLEKFYKAGGDNYPLECTQWQVLKKKLADCTYCQNRFRTCRGIGCIDKSKFVPKDQEIPL